MWFALSDGEDVTSFDQKDRKGGVLNFLVMENWMILYVR